MTKDKGELEGEVKVLTAEKRELKKSEAQLHITEDTLDLNKQKISEQASTIESLKKERDSLRSEVDN